MEFKYSIIYFQSILLCLIPLALLTGPFLPDLFLSIISICFLYLAITEKDWKYFKNLFFLIFSLFYLYLVLCSLLSENVSSSLRSSLFYFRFIIFSLAVWYIINNNKNILKIFTYSLLITFIFALLDGYLQFFYSTGIFNIDSPNHRLTLLYDDKLILGGYLVRLFPLLIGLLIYNFEFTNKNIIFFAIILIATEVLIYLSGERTAIALLAILSLFLIFLIRRFKLIRIFTLILSISAIVFLTFNFPDVKNRNIGMTLYQLKPPNESIKIFSQTHDSLYKTAINIFSDNKFFGVGPNLFRDYCDMSEYMHSIKAYSCGTHPHNSYFQLLSETGIFGFTIVFLIYIYLCLICLLHLVNTYFINKNSNFNYSQLSDYQICLIGCFFLSLFPFLPTQDFFNNWINVIFFLPVGFFLQSVYKSSNLKV